MARGKKTGGRTKGTPNKATREIREVAQHLTLQNPRYRTNLRRRLQTGNCAPAVEVFILAHGYGQPPKEHKHSGKLTLEQLVAGSAVAEGSE